MRHGSIDGQLVEIWKPPSIPLKIPYELYIRRSHHTRYIGNGALQLLETEYEEAAGCVLSIIDKTKALVEAKTVLDDCGQLTDVVHFSLSAAQFSLMHQKVAGMDGSDEYFELLPKMVARVNYIPENHITLISA